jgi:large subunit ribosomal protein L21e
MVKRSRGFFSKTNRKIKAERRMTVNDFLRTFEVGDRVLIKPAPRHLAMPHRRYWAKVGVVVEKRGRAYVVEVKVGKSTKKIITYGFHLKKV